MKLEIDDDTVDEIIVASLRQSIELLEKDIARLKKVKKREAYQNEDLTCALADLAGLKVACVYYGGDIK